MPRQPRLPIEILRLEGLSDGRPMGAPMVDDFTGAPLPMAERTRTHAIPPNVQGVQDTANTQRHRGNTQVLAAGGIVPKAEGGQPTPARGAMIAKLKELLGMASTACPPSALPTITLTKKEWRRI